MKNLKKISVLLMVAMVIIVSNLTFVSASINDNTLEMVINDTAKYMYKTVSNPEVGSVGGEWAVIGLARSNYSVPQQYYDQYYSNVEKYVKAKKGNLHDKKYTEYSRLAVALTSIGKNPADVAGYNLLTPLGDYEKTIWQGLNGPVWALIALDSGNYDMPQNSKAATKATRQMYVDRILECQLLDGGWSLLGDGTATYAHTASDPDITGTVLQALANYQDNPSVKKATNQALEIMSKQQNINGGYSREGKESSESLVQVIVGLGELGVSLNDPRFVKNGNTMLDNLMNFYQTGNGFLHTEKGDGSGQMLSEQSLYGLVSMQRFRDGKNSLYNMNDVSGTQIEETPDMPSSTGLPGKHKDIDTIPVSAPGRTFGDVSGSNQLAIEALASRGIINGKSENLFAPNATVTRAEFATIVVNSLGLKPNKNNKFKDVVENIWYAPYVGAANSYGIVGGVTDTEFNPNGTITKQEAAVMVARAAELSGLDTQIDATGTRDVLAQFTDYTQSKEWARPALAFCYNEHILDQSDLGIKPNAPMSRGEIAQMIFNMLKAAELI